MELMLMKKQRQSYSIKEGFFNNIFTTLSLKFIFSTLRIKIGINFFFSISNLYICFLNLIKL